MDFWEPAALVLGAALIVLFGVVIARGRGRPALTQPRQTRPTADEDKPGPFGSGNHEAPVSAHSLFVGLVLIGDDGDVEAYLVNNTPTAYSRLVTRTGMYADGDGEFVESTVAVREHGALRPFSALLLEASTRYQRDFYIWYRMELWQSGSDEPLTGDFLIPKQVWTLPKLLLPIVNKEGAVLFERETPTVPPKVVGRGTS